MANWSAIGALGEAAKASGDYFGVLAVEKTRTQRLAEARAEQLADRTEGRVYNAKLATDAATAKEAERKAEAIRVADLLEDKHDHEEEVREAGNIEHDRRAGNKPPTIVTTIDPIIDKNGTRHYMWSDGEYRPETTEGGHGVIYEGSDEAQLIADSSRQAQEGGEWLPGMKTGELTPELVADTRPVFKKPVDPVDEESGPTREFEAKAKYQAQGAAIGLDDMLEQMEKGYRPGGTSALLDQWFTGTDVGNLVVSDQAQAYQRGATQLYENLLRRATGAAAPDTEVTRYFKMFIPRAGDGPETIASKLESAGRMIEAMDGMGSPDLGPDFQGEDKEWDRQWRLRAYQITKGIVPTKDGGKPPFTGGGEPSATASKYY